MPADKLLVRCMEKELLQVQCRNAGIRCRKRKTEDGTWWNEYKEMSVLIVRTEQCIVRTEQGIPNFVLIVGEGVLRQFSGKGDRAARVLADEWASQVLPVHR